MVGLPDSFGGHKSLLRRRMRTANSRLSVFIAALITTSATFFVYRKNHTNMVSINPYPNCTQCNGLSESHGDSTTNDLVLAAIFGGGNRIAPFLRSLRSVGCKARVVLITNLTIDHEQSALYERCGAELFHMSVNETMMGLYPHSLRYIGYKQYLSQNKHKIDRVLHSDSFDVFFQSDPFTSDISPSNLYFVLEEPQIKNSTWNTGWLERAYNTSIAQELGNYTVSCSGTIIGGSKQFYLYLDTLLNHPPFWKNGRHSLDQAYHNYLLHTGEFTRNGVSQMFLGCNSSILTMHYCSRYGREHIRSNRVYSPDKSTVPAVVHQYNLFHSTSKLLKKVCQSEPPL